MPIGLASPRDVKFRAMMMIMTQLMMKIMKLLTMKMMLTMMTIASGRLRTVATSPERSLPSASVSIHSHLGFVYTHILLQQKYCNAIVAILLLCSQPCFKAYCPSSATVSIHLGFVSS